VAWGAHNAAFSGSNKSAGTDVVVGSVAWSAGEILIAYTVWDDVGLDTVSGGTGLSWTNINRASGGAGDTYIAGNIWAALAPSSQSGQSVTLAVGASVAAKALLVQVFPVGGSIIEATGTENSEQFVGSTTPSVTTFSDPASGELVLGLVVIEGPSDDSYTSDADTTNGSWSSPGSSGTTGGNAITNVTLRSQYKIVSASGPQTFNPTLGTARDSRTLIAVLTPAADAAGRRLHTHLRAAHRASLH
jgi:hypothetical protein